MLYRRFNYTNAAKIQELFSRIWRPWVQHEIETGQKLTSLHPDEDKILDSDRSVSEN